MNLRQRQPLLESSRLVKMRTQKSLTQSRKVTQSFLSFAAFAPLREISKRFRKPHDAGHKRSLHDAAAKLIVTKEAV